MKTNSYWGEIVVSLILIILASVLLNPFDWWMPSMIVTCLLIIFMVFFAMLTAFVWREKPKDEREEVHRLYSGRVAFIIGTVVIVVGIILQELQKNLDPWLVYALWGMIFGKLLGQWYSRSQR